MDWENDSSVYSKTYEELWWLSKCYFGGDKFKDRNLLKVWNNRRFLSTNEHFIQLFFNIHQFQKFHRHLDINNQFQSRSWVLSFQYWEWEACLENRKASEILFIKSNWNSLNLSAHYTISNFSYLVILKESNTNDTTSEIKIFGTSPNDLPVDENVTAIVQQGYIFNPECLDYTIHSKTNSVVESCEDLSKMKSITDIARINQVEDISHQSRSDAGPDGKSIQFSFLSSIGELVFHIRERLFDHQVKTYPFF